MIQTLLLIFLSASLYYFGGQIFRKIESYLYAAILAVSCLFFVTHIQGIQHGPITQSIIWSKHFGVELSFLLDGLSLVFALLVTGIGTGVFLYAGAYMKNSQNRSGFFATLMIFTGSMLGLVLSDNLILTFIFWELTSLTSFLLIGFKHYKEQVRESARTALFLTVGGGLCLLVGILMISAAGQSGGLSLVKSLSFSSLTEANLSDHPYYLAILFLVALAVATKSAQVPFHFWLPLAMAGPTPVSSFLHSATMVKAGVFLLAKLFPILGGTTEWTAIFVLFGATTMVVGGSTICIAKRYEKNFSLLDNKCTGHVNDALRTRNSDGNQSGRCLRCSPLHFTKPHFFKLLEILML